jgi:hypothetical protein
LLVSRVYPTFGRAANCVKVTASALRYQPSRISHNNKLTFWVQVVAEAIKILKVVEKHTDNKFDFKEHLFGGVSCTPDRNSRKRADVM